MSTSNLFFGKRRLFNLWVAVFTVCIIGFIASETHWNFARPLEENKSTLIEDALIDAYQTFKDEESVFVENTTQLLNSLIPVFTIENNKVPIYNRLKNDKNFWGVSVYKNSELLAWTGIPEQDFPFTDLQNIWVDVRVTNYVTYLVAGISHFEGNDRYDIVTTKLLLRSGATPQLLTEQINIPEKWAADTGYPVSFTFGSGDIADTGPNIRVLKTQSGQTVGQVSASTADFRALARSWHQNMIWYRYSFLLLGILLFYMLVLLMLSNSKLTYKWILAAVLTFCVWLTFYRIGIPIPRLLFAGTATGTILILELFREAFFMLLISLFIHLHLKDKKATIKSISISEISIYALLFGASSFWVIDKLYNTVFNTQTEILSLQIVPMAETWVVYFSSLFMVGGLIVLTLQLLQLSQFHVKRNFAHSVFTVSFLAGYIIRFFINGDLFYPGLFFLILGMIGLFIWILNYRPGVLAVPKPRLISALVFLVVVLSSPQLFKAEVELENAEMKRMAVNFARSDASQAEMVSRQLLQNIANDPIIQQIQNLETVPTFPIYEAAQFRSRVNDFIQPDWESYSIMAFLLDGRLNIITDFGSQTAFSDRFSTSFHDEVKEFIRNSLRRPFARLPIIETDERFTGFPVFVKGLQSIPSDFPTQPSWIVTFVLVEGNTFGRPLNDALAFQERDKENWGRFIVTEYTNGVLTRKASAPRAPVYPVQFINNTRFEVPFVIEKSSSPIPIRRVIYSSDGGNTVISIVRDQTILNFIFSGFRFFASLLVILLAIFHLTRLVVYWEKESKPRQKFHDRILDSYLLATLLFLISLALVTEFIVTRQNIRIAEQELAGNLNALEEQIRKGSNISSVLDDLSRDLDVMVFSSNRLSNSTAGEVFDLMLLSQYLPFETYFNINHNNLSSFYQRINVGNLPVLMGYRAIIENGDVRYVIGIPAYIRSAAFEEEFLQTTSYLIAFYIIIFMFFTGGAWFVSRRLTQPLEEFQFGLKQISTGNLDTKIPVTTNDEIGELAAAYNQMISDLKNLREELALAEREAAWAEMAQQVAHEIKNPLTPMKLKIQHLQMRLSSPDFNIDDMKPEIRKLNDVLIQQIESLNTIASQFSKFAKPLIGNFTLKSPLHLIESAIELYDKTAGATFEIQAENELPEIEVIEDEILRVFINLIKNAIEASGDTCNMRIMLRKESNSVVFDFIDSGYGISEEDQKHIFKPNFSTKTSGTGLGLAISRKIIEAHKGSIAVSSESGKGSTFRITLPITQK